MSIHNYLYTYMYVVMAPGRVAEAARREAREQSGGPRQRARKGYLNKQINKTYVYIYIAHICIYVHVYAYIYIYMHTHVHMYISLSLSLSKGRGLLPRARQHLSALR